MFEASNSVLKEELKTFWTDSHMRHSDKKPQKQTMLKLSHVHKHTQVYSQDHMQRENVLGGDSTLLKALLLSPDTIPINPTCQSDPQVLKIGQWAPSDQTPACRQTWWQRTELQYTLLRQNSGTGVWCCTFERLHAKSVWSGEKKYNFKMLWMQPEICHICFYNEVQLVMWVSFTDISAFTA